MQKAFLISSHEALWHPSGRKPRLSGSGKGKAHLPALTFFRAYRLDSILRASPTNPRPTTSPSRLPDTAAAPDDPALEAAPGPPVDDLCQNCDIALAVAWNVDLAILPVVRDDRKPV